MKDLNQPEIRGWFSKLLHDAFKKFFGESPRIGDVPTSERKEPQMSTANQSGGPVLVLDLLKNLLGRVAASEELNQKLIAKSEILSKVIEEDSDLKAHLSKLDPRDLLQVQKEIESLQKQFNVVPSGPTSVNSAFLTTAPNTPVSLPSPTNFFGARAGFMTLGQAMDGQMNVGFLSGPAVMKQIEEQLTGIVSRLDGLEKATCSEKKEDKDGDQSSMEKLAKMVDDLGKKVETLALAKGDETPTPETPTPEAQGSSEGAGTSMEDTPPADNGSGKKFEKNNNEPPVFDTADVWGGFQRTDKS